MGKKMVFFLLAVCLLLAGSGYLKEKKEILQSHRIEKPKNESQKEPDSWMAKAKDREEAEKIAKLYGIRLIDFQYGVATYETTKKTEELLRIGKENNYPALFQNQTKSIN